MPKQGNAPTPARAGRNAQNGLPAELRNGLDAGEAAPEQATAGSEPEATDANETERKDSYATPALEKGLDVIELLAREPRGLTKSQVARGLNRTVSEIFRMLLCLERRGYISQVEDERYSLTLKLFQLVQEHPPTERLVTEALPVLHRVTLETLQSCHLGVIEAGRVVIVAQVNAPTSSGFYVKLGSSLDMLKAASGYVILAHQEPAMRERSVAEWMRRSGTRVPQMLPPDFYTHLSKIRRAGHEKRASYQVKGVVNLSVPVLNHRNSAIGAITVPYIEHAGETLPMATVLETLERAAAEITRALGGRGRVATTGEME